MANHTNLFAIGELELVAFNVRPQKTATLRRDSSFSLFSSAANHTRRVRRRCW